MLPALLILAAVQATETPSCAVVRASRRSGTEAVGAKVIAQVLTALSGEGLVVLPEKNVSLGPDLDPSRCQGARACLGKVAAAVGSPVVGVDVAKAQRRFLVHLSAIASDGALLHEVDFETASTTWKEELDGPVSAFARVVRERLQPPPPAPLEAKPARADAPLVATEPAPTPALELRQTPEPNRGRGPGRWVALGGTGVAVVATTTFTLLAFSTKAAIDASRYDAGGVVGSTLTEAQLREKVEMTNATAAGALVSAVLSVVLAGATTWLFLQPEVP